MSKYKPKERDSLGTRVGTAAAAVNRALTGQWQTVEQIQKESGQPMKSVKRRLYNGVEMGLYCHEKIIRFKLKKKATKK